MVVIVFLFCQMPTAIVLIYTSIHNAERGSPEENILRGLGNIFNLLVAINASCNFLLYTALSDKYRKYFCAFFFCQRRKTPSNPRQFDGNPYELDTMDTTLRYALGPFQKMMPKKWRKEKAENCKIRHKFKNGGTHSGNCETYVDESSLDENSTVAEVSFIAERNKRSYHNTNSTT